MMKFVVLASTIFSAAYGFAPSSFSVRRTASRVGMSEEEPVVLAQEGEETTTMPVAETFATVGSGSLAWNPDASKPCYGLPGAIAPLGFFDPLGFSKDKELGGVKRLREAEVMHCRVAMMAVVGYLIGESTPTITYGFTIPHTIANDQIPEVPGTVLFPFFLLINICEAYRANRGWVCYSCYCRRILFVARGAIGFLVSHASLALSLTHCFYRIFSYSSSG